jgi:hypothetical protein
MIGTPYTSPFQSPASTISGVMVSSSDSAVRPPLLRLARTPRSAKASIQPTPIIITSGTRPETTPVVSFSLRRA